MRNQYNKKLLVFNEDTQEFESATPLKDDETFEIVRKTKDLNGKQLRYLKDKDCIERHNDNLGGFVFMYFSDLIYNKNFDLELATISRIIYLATYIDYDNNLVLNNEYSCNLKKEFMTKKDIKEVMKLGKCAFSQFFNEVTEKEILIEVEKNKRYKINEQYFKRGKLTKEDKNRGNFTRVYIKTVRKLYVNTNSRNHKCLSYMFKLLPFIDLRTNLLVFNPNQETEDLQKITLRDIGDFFGISKDRKNLNKFLDNNLFKIFIYEDGKKYWILNEIFVKNGGGLDDYFAINPMLFYGGNEYDNISFVIKQLLVK